MLCTCIFRYDGKSILSFCVLGGVGVLWFVAWMLIVYDSPEKHPRISERERDYILGTLEGKISNKKKVLFTTNAFTPISMRVRVFYTIKYA